LHSVVCISWLLTFWKSSGKLWFCPVWKSVETDFVRFYPMFSQSKKVNFAKFAENWKWIQFAIFLSEFGWGSNPGSFGFAFIFSQQFCFCRRNTYVEHKWTSYTKNNCFTSFLDKVRFFLKVRGQQMNVLSNKRISSECIKSRVNRLIEFSPIGRLFTLGSY
jgi:hypothetical protein